MFACISYFEEEKRESINAASKTNAIGWATFANMFSSKGSAKTRFSDLLPYPGKGQEATRMPKHTQRILIDLVREEKIPRWAIEQAKLIPEVAKELGK